MPIAFDNSYARLPDSFYSPQLPTPVANPTMVQFNATLAAEIGVAETDFDAEILTGNRIPDGAEPIAQAYAGHQFGGFVPQLGDGRAILLGEVVGPDGERRDIQLKGSGPTIYSRNGDGRAAIGPALREYVVSEAMAALGIPTTRALAVATTGEMVVREQILPGAVITRVASSHIRVGTFQYHYARGDLEAVKQLSDHVIARHYPQASEADNSVLAMFELVVAKQARLVARWMQVGFIHGVMNTDNCSIAGETIDYGPCAFMDAFDRAKVFSSIDQHGRYAWGNQPQIAHWNLAQLAQTLLPLFESDHEKAKSQAESALSTFPEVFAQAYTRGLAQKIGVLQDDQEGLKLANDLLDLMTRDEVDFTLLFRRLTTSVQTGELSPVREMFNNHEQFENWAELWQEQTRNDDTAARIKTMRSANPVFIPRNHRLQEAITAANTSDFAPFRRLLKVLAHPYQEQPEYAEFENPPEPDEVVCATFCGT